MRKLSIAIENDIKKEFSDVDSANMTHAEMQDAAAQIREVAAHSEFTPDGCRERLRIVPVRQQATVAAIVADRSRVDYQRGVDCLKTSTSDRETVICFLDMAKISRTTEGAAILNHAVALAQLVYTQDHRLPVGTTEETPLRAAWHCGEATHADWSAPQWAALGMKIDDAVRFRYRYDGDGTGFKVTASGDEDCDGTEATFTVVGTVVDGKLSTLLSLPPAGVY